MFCTQVLIIVFVLNESWQKLLSVILKRTTCNNDKTRLAQFNDSKTSPAVDNTVETNLLKSRYSEKGHKIWHHLPLSNVKYKWKMGQILWPSQNIGTLLRTPN